MDPRPLAGVFFYLRAGVLYRLLKDLLPAGMTILPWLQSRPQDGPP